MSEAQQVPNPNTQTQAPPQNQGEDQNLKQEFNRKFENINTKVDNVLQTTQALIEQLNRQELSRRDTQTTISGEADKSLNDLLYDDPEEYARQIEARTEKRIKEQIEAKEKQINANSAIVNRLQTDYPELTDSNNPLTKRAAELLMNEDNQNDPKVWRTVVMEAAQELGIRPSKYRGQDSDYSMGSSGTTRRTASERNKAKGLEKETLEFAKIMGLDTEDPKTIERLEKHASRNWNRYR